MVIEEESSTSPLERPSHEEQEVRGVAGVYEVERALAGELSQEPGHVPGWVAVLPGIAWGAPVRGDRREPVNANALAQLEWLAVTFGALRTHDIDFEAGAGKSARLVPNPPVERHREVLVEDDDPTRRCRHNPLCPAAPRRPEGGRGRRRVSRSSAPVPRSPRACSSR